MQSEQKSTKSVAETTKRERTGKQIDEAEAEAVRV